LLIKAADRTVERPWNMDFDDLNDVEDAVASYQPTEYMTPIVHNFRFPPLSDIPEQIYKTLPEDVERKVSLRVFSFIGAGDLLMYWWRSIMNAPPWAELAVHEWPSHGTRAEEPPPASLDALTDDAFKGIVRILEQHQPSGRLAGAPFAFIGHSVGALLVTTLCKRLRDEMGLEPAAVVVLDRAPPHMPLFSPYGSNKMQTDPKQFLKEYIPDIAANAEKVGGEKGDKMTQMWLDDIKLAIDTRDVGFYTFPCELLILRARKNELADTERKNASPEAKVVHELRDKLMFSSPGSAMDFDFAMFEEWAKWSSADISIQDIDSAHIGIKDHKDADKAIWDFLAKVKAVNPA